MLQLIIFDWDDVFTIGSTNAYHACYIEAAHQAGSETDPEHIREVVNDLWGRPHEDVIRGYLAEENLLEETNKNYERLIHTSVFLDELTLLPGSIELLTRLSKRYRLAIVSGINPKLLQQVFKQFAVPTVFEKITTSYDLADRSRGKPCPDMVIDTLQTLKVAPESAICVGDAPGDMKMATAAGVTPVAVLTGQLDRSAAEDLGVTHILERVTDLEELLVAIQ